MPGAGGISAANYLYSLAAKDGSIIGGIQNTVPFEPLLGTTQAKFDPRRFGWIGSPSSETGVLFVWHDAPVNSFQDLLSKEITIATSGADSEPSFYGRLFNAVLGTKMRLVSGYPGQSEAYMAMENREVDGYPVGYWSSLNASKPEWLRDKKIKILLQFGERPNKELPNVPFALDFAKSDADRALLKAAFAPLAIGRPYLTPPGVPKRLLSALREAFVETMADPQYVIDAKRAHLASANPHTGSEVQDLIDQAYATPSDVLSRLRKLTRE
jgi:tripartite-type tricarboxylate transporter receptor subunit TctC